MTQWNKAMETPPTDPREYRIQKQGEAEILLHGNDVFYNPTQNNSVRQLPAHGPVVPQECSDCGRKFVMGGPIWSDPIHDPDWILSTLSNVVAMKHRYPAYEKVHSVLTSVSEELLDVPLSVDLHDICSTLKCTAPSSVVFKSALINAGYKASGTHTNPNAVKTDAPMNFI